MIHVAAQITSIKTNSLLEQGNNSFRQDKANVTVYLYHRTEYKEGVNSLHRD